MDTYPEPVLVEWLEACQHPEEPDPDSLGVLIYSTGFVHSDTPAGLVLVPSWSPTAYWEDYLEIPRAYIVSITNLAPG